MLLAVGIAVAVITAIIGLGCLAVYGLVRFYRATAMPEDHKRFVWVFGRKDEGRASFRSTWGLNRESWSNKKREEADGTAYLPQGRMHNPHWQNEGSSGAVKFTDDGGGGGD